MLLAGTTGSGAAIAGALAAHGFEVVWSPPPPGGPAALDLDRVDLVVVDGRSPTAVATVRAVRGRARTLVVTEPGDDRGTALLLDSGADAFTPHPVGPRLLGAWARALLRGDPGVGREVVAGELALDLGARTARLGDRELGLTRREFDLLAHLVHRRGQVVGREELLARVWGRSGSSRTVDVHVSWLRRKLGESARAPRYLHTVRGVGFTLEPPTAPPVESIPR
ncbi:hypothetical protein BJP25_18115 [Actinokineospora bangkokensis]|uniref:OmpR/PhoB-type domain-containing protein n=1 Tax=Actinokineospora bangkokensis TaxID=1193682 RepID=A0A1Q9LLM4_9PSEU|nr:hypothetical protein BJP25_18115 [Actinokineospora bangkokensis]